jgi:hypothetical protein
MSLATIELEKPKKSREATFTSWYKQFVNFNGGFKLEDPAGFSRKVTNSKKQLRELLGGVRKIQKIELKERIIPLSESAARHYLDIIIRYLPTYLREYDLKRSDLLNPTLEKFKGIKTTKHILTFARKFFNGTSHYHYDEVRYATEGLGGLYSTSKITAGTYWVNISTAPQAFALLGHYGPDTGSCFSQHGVNKSHKYSLAQSKNTFVIVISNKEISQENPQRKSTCARAWGFYNAKDNTFNVSNVYPMQNSTLISFANTEECIKIAIENILGSPTKKIDNIFAIKDRLIYLNNFPLWTFYPDNSSIPKLQTLEISVAKGQ